MKFTADSSKTGGSYQRNARLVYENMPEQLVGQMCQIVEMLGLKDAQEKATKDTIKNLIYESFSHDRGCIYVDRNLVEVIEQIVWKERDYANKEGILIGEGEYTLIKTIPDTEEVK